MSIMGRNRPVAGTAILGSPLIGMSLLKTLLGAVTLCAALLTVLSFALGPDRPDTQAQPPGLTAAAVLASDGMGPRPERIVVGGTEGAQPAG